MGATGRTGLSWAGMALMAILCLMVSRPAAGADPALRLRVLTTDFVLPGKLQRLVAWAEAAGAQADFVRIDRDQRPAGEWLEGIDLIILDTPRPNDLAQVQARLGDRLAAAPVAWIRVGGGPPAFGNLGPDVARRLIGYYAQGREINLRRLVDYALAWRRGDGAAGIAPPVPLPPTGIYHPDAADVFPTPEAYLAWGAPRWRPGAPRIAVAIHAGLVSGLQTTVVDTLIRRAEARGILPAVFWFDAAEAQGMSRIVGPLGADVIVSMTHLQNGPARAVELKTLDLPALATFSYRDGAPDAWRQANSGLDARAAAALLSVPEGWGFSDPLVVSAVAGGDEVAIGEQFDALLAKAARLAALRRKPAADKRLALMFWNHPAGEGNVSASHLNVPRSLVNLTAALGTAGYDVPTGTEAELIATAQAMLGGLYHPDRLEALAAEGRAMRLPLDRYRAWFDGLPAARRAAIVQRWGEPGDHALLRGEGADRHFVIPATASGKLLVLPQPPRSGRPGDAYHDLSAMPDHPYLAAYLYVREVFGADALIHFGTHGTQEWLPGKDRGLSVDDLPFIAVGDLPVFYPYIQDNVAEAMQARRRGRAVTVSHQTPPMAPAGLYDTLRDLHGQMHEHAALEDGPVRTQVEARVTEIAIAANLHRDLGWDDAAIPRDFPTFLAALHDHLHDLARAAMPLGLHSFGEAAAPEHRLSTVMQQLGKAYYEALGLDPNEVFAGDFSALRQSLPYATLDRHLRQGVGLDEIADPTLRAMIERGAALDRHLAETGEIEALLAGLAGRFIAPGPGGDPVRTPDVPSGRNLHAFEPDRLPTAAAYDAGGKALAELIAAHAREHDGIGPAKLAFSLWSSEAIRHLGVTEGMVLHALGLRPRWDAGGRVVALDIVPAPELGRPRIDVVLQVTGVYRDQFDGFMRLLADGITRIAALDEAGNAVARNARAQAEALIAGGRAPDRAWSLATQRLFGGAPGSYDSGLPGEVLGIDGDPDEAHLAADFVDRLKYAYGPEGWGMAEEGVNLFADQLRDVDAAVMSRSSSVHGLLSTDHPFEYLGGLSLAVRELSGRAPGVYIADLRQTAGRVSTAARFLAAEMRQRYLNPHWVGGMQREGYAGTLEVLNAANNLWGWQVTDPATVRPDQWQAMHDTYLRDIHKLGVKDWFDQANPGAAGQLVERLMAAIDAGYWAPDDDVRRELAARLDQVVRDAAYVPAKAASRRVAAAAGFGLDAPAAVQPAAADAGSAETMVQGQVLAAAAPSDMPPDQPWQRWAAFGLLAACLLGGALRHIVLNHRLSRSTL